MFIPRRVWLSFLLLSFVAFTATLPNADPQRYLEDVKFLASPALAGRGDGSPGLERAGVYIAEQFRKAGLRTDLQAFSVTMGAKPGTQNTVESNNQQLGMGSDFLPLSFSSNGLVKAPLVFAGYGISANDLHYDDYANLDVRDKIVLVLRREPPSFAKETGGRERAFTHHAQLVSKAINARNHGAKAMILVNGEFTERGEDALIRFGSVSGPEDAGLLIIQVKNQIAEKWLSSTGKSLASMQKAIDGSNTPSSFALPGPLQVSVQVDIKREHATVHNVIGYLPGRTSEYIIVGAHYDHLGLGNENSLAPSQLGQVHPGADDNASGTAGLIELARLLATRRDQLNRGILFIAFAGEESGLLGSAHWVEKPTLPVDKAVAMLNMDMIGRVKGSKLYVSGTGTGSTFEPLLKHLTARYNFKIDSSADGYSSSDHTSFVAKRIPVLFFFSGLHSDYHKPSDTWDKIDAPDAARIVDLVGDVAINLSTANERPQFVKVLPTAHGGAPGGVGGGYGPYFGSIPDFGPVENGVKFADVRPGSPADKAGLRSGDILVQFGDKPIKNLYDFTFALRASKVGDVVDVKVLREGKEVNARVTLEQRR